MDAEVRNKTNQRSRIVVLPKGLKGLIEAGLAFSGLQGSNRDVVADFSYRFGTINFVVEEKSGRGLFRLFARKKSRIVTVGLIGGFFDIRPDKCTFLPSDSIIENYIDVESETTYSIDRSETTSSSREVGGDVNIGQKGAAEATVSGKRVRDSGTAIDATQTTLERSKSRRAHAKIVPPVLPRSALRIEVREPTDVPGKGSRRVYTGGTSIPSIGRVSDVTNQSKLAAIFTVGEGMIAVSDEHGVFRTPAQATMAYLALRKELTGVGFKLCHAVIESPEDANGF